MVSSTGMTGGAGNAVGVETGTLELLHRPGIIRGPLADWLLATPASCAAVACAIRLLELSAARSCCGRKRGVLGSC